MKSSIKKIFAILFSLVMLVTLSSMTIPVSAENEGTGTYISALSGFVLTKENWEYNWSMENVEFQKNVDMLSERGYSALQFDFNQEAYNEENFLRIKVNNADYNYRYAPFALGYQTATGKDDAITGIVISYGENPDATIESNGITYNLMGGWEFEDEIVKVDGLDFNRFTHGDYIYLYYTKDAKAGAPIMALKGSNAATEPGYECVLDMSDNPADLNSESDMDNECTVYLHIQRDASTVGSVFGDGNTLILVIAAVVVIIGVGLVIFFVKKKKA